MFTEVVEFSDALKEVDALLDRKVIYPRRRSALKNAIESVAEGIQYGFVTIETDDTITQKLADPIRDSTGSVVLSELKYKSRLDMGAVNAKLSEIPITNQDGRLMVYVTSLTGEAAGIINKMNSGDKNIAESIALFFS